MLIRTKKSLDAVQTFCIDESDQLLMPTRNGIRYCDYFDRDHKVNIDEKEFGKLEGQLMAALHNMKLLQYAIEKKGDREIEMPKPQVILTSAQPGFQIVNQCYFYTILPRLRGSQSDLA